LSKKFKSTKEIALGKLQRYCAYQDRCHQEVRSKLIELQIYGDDLEEIISELIQENFLNEERFARSFARGKFRIKKWGKIKIRQELKKRKLSDYCLKKAMEEIEADDYLKELKILLQKKLSTLKETDPFKRKQKLAAYALRKGFEPPLVWQLVKEVVE